MSLYHRNLRAFTRAQEAYDWSYDTSYDEEQEEEKFCTCSRPPSEQEDKNNLCNECGWSYS